MKMDAYPATEREKALERQTGGLSLWWKRRVERIRGTLNKWVVFDKDAIFKDPDWPHLWEHKR